MHTVAYGLEFLRPLHDLVLFDLFGVVLRPTLVVFRLNSRNTAQYTGEFTLPMVPLNTFGEAGRLVLRKYLRASVENPILVQMFWTSVVRRACSETLLPAASL